MARSAAFSPPGWSQYETSAQVWQAYRDRRVNALVTWVSNYLTNLPPDTAAVPIPTLDDTPFTLATGWGWAVADPIAPSAGLSIKLAEFLSQGDFLAEWTEAAGYLPTRPSTLAAWTNQSLKTLLSPVAISRAGAPHRGTALQPGPGVERGHGEGSEERERPDPGSPGRCGTVGCAGEPLR